MKDDTVNLSRAEWGVMECLWESSPLTGREIVERMSGNNGWSRSTTLTLLGRLETKGAVSSDAGGGVKVYGAAIARDDTALSETRDFLGRVYKGSLSLMVSSLTEREALTSDEIDELCAILRKAEAKRDD